MSDRAKDVRNLLTDARRLVSQLGWDSGMRANGRGVLIRCPNHGEREASCGITHGPDGTLRSRCFACGWSADALGMIALAHALDVHSEFGEVIAIGAELGGRPDIAEEIRDKRNGRTVRRSLAAVRAPEPVPAREYPDAREVAEFWRVCGKVGRSPEASRMLLRRGIRFDLVDDLSLARSTDGRLLPRGATYKGVSWVRTGHTLILPSWDATGALRSVRGWMVSGGNFPKRLPLSGFRQSGLVLANRPAVAMLRGAACPLRLWIVEGEPDFLSAATEFGIFDAVIGIGSGSWTDEFARRVPIGTKVMVATHADAAGDRYADQVIASLGDERNVWRWRPAS